MKTDIGEYIVGAYLKLIEQCDVVDYNVKPPGGGLRGLEEIDVVGLHFKSQTAYLCEATTHIGGTLYKTNKNTVEKITQKYNRQKQYARSYLREFPNRRYMFWSPVVPVGYVTQNLAAIRGLELIINKEYAARVEKLRQLAASTMADTNNPFFRVLQILEHLRH